MTMTRRDNRRGSPIRPAIAAEESGEAERSSEVEGGSPATALAKNICGRRRTTGGEEQRVKNNGEQRGEEHRVVKKNNGEKNVLYGVEAQRVKGERTGSGEQWRR